MLDFLWATMIVGGVLFGCIQGPEIINAVAGSAIDSAKEAVQLCIVMLGVVGLWNGIMNIAKEAGLIAKWTKGIDPAITFLFPRIPKEDTVRQDIAMNMIANMLGLGWAATPAGLRAMKGLARLQDEREANKMQVEKTEGNKRENRKSKKRQTEKSHRRVATDEMCALLVLNISSLQLIPVNIIAYRSQYGSADPTAVIGPGIVATTVSTLTAVLFCRLMYKRRKE
ncbi:MAG: nucleoside recognition protein [Lachnospiraceae bacterium]|nr:nucleoside recognition protein [Lachnospiraceae bacterium]